MMTLHVKVIGVEQRNGTASNTPSENKCDLAQHFRKFRKTGRHHKQGAFESEQ